MTAPQRRGADGERRRRPTSTARFGSSRRESHDSSVFYQRFVAPELSADAAVAPPGAADVIHVGDARRMAAVEAGSVALVVTSPPYFAGKEYEASLGQDGVPASYFDYLGLLRDVFSECKRALEPGGRIAVNVANLGRRPYRSLAGDVTGILQDLGLLLRGEVVWWKGRAAGGSCAWGSFQHPGNPVLRDVTERIVIASKGRFDRAVPPARRAAEGLPSTTTISRDEFLEATTDLWEMPPESATRVGHPAPFPVELPTRLIELYTYEGDLVLDPFMGSGTTAVAAVSTGRRFVGYDTDPAYVERANERVARARRAAPDRAAGVRVPAVAGVGDGDGAVARAVRAGRQAKEVAVLLLRASGFVDVRSDARLAPGVEGGLLATDATGREWAFLLCGGFTSTPSGLRRSDALWRALGMAAVFHAARPGVPLVVLTTARPAAAGAGALDALVGPTGAVFDVVELLDAADRERLRRFGAGEASR